MEPRGAICGEDALERDLCAFGDFADRLRTPLELAEDDLVLAQEDRAQVPDRGTGRETGVTSWTRRSSASRSASLTSGQKHSATKLSAAVELM